MTTEYSIIGMYFEYCNGQLAYNVNKNKKRLAFDAATVAVISASRKLRLATDIVKVA